MKYKVLKISFSGLSVPLYSHARVLCYIFSEKAVNGEDEQMRSPAKSDTLRSTDSASGGETLEERSSKEVR